MWLLLTLDHWLFQNGPQKAGTRGGNTLQNEPPKKRTRMRSSGRQDDRRSGLEVIVECIPKAAPGPEVRGRHMSQRNEARGMHVSRRDAENQASSRRRSAPRARYANNNNTDTDPNTLYGQAADKKLVSHHDRDIIDTQRPPGFVNVAVDKTQLSRSADYKQNINTDTRRTHLSGCSNISSNSRRNEQSTCSSGTMWDVSRESWSLHTISATGYDDTLALTNDSEAASMTLNSGLTASSGLAPESWSLHTISATGYDNDVSRLSSTTGSNSTLQDNSSQSLTPSPALKSRPPGTSSQPIPIPSQRKTTDAEQTKSGGFCEKQLVDNDKPRGFYFRMKQSTPKEDVVKREPMFRKDYSSVMKLEWSGVSLLDSSEADIEMVEGHRLDVLDAEMDVTPVSSANVNYTGVGPVSVNPVETDGVHPQDMDLGNDKWSLTTGDVLPGVKSLHPGVVDISQQISSVEISSRKPTMIYDCKTWRKKDDKPSVSVKSALDRSTQSTQSVCADAMKDNRARYMQYLDTKKPLVNVSNRFSALHMSSSSSSSCASSKNTSSSSDGSRHRSTELQDYSMSPHLKHSPHSLVADPDVVRCRDDDADEVFETESKRRCDSPRIRSWGHPRITSPIGTLSARLNRKPRPVKIAQSNFATLDDITESTVEMILNACKSRSSVDEPDLADDALPSGKTISPADTCHINSTAHDPGKVATVGSPEYFRFGKDGTPPWKSTGHLPPGLLPAACKPAFTSPSVLGVPGNYKVQRSPKSDTHVKPNIPGHHVDSPQSKPRISTHSNQRNTEKTTELLESLVLTDKKPWISTIKCESLTRHSVYSQPDHQVKTISHGRPPNLDRLPYDVFTNSRSLRMDEKIEWSKQQPTMCG